MSVIDRIAMVTIACGDLAAAQKAYCRYLHHEVVDAGRIPGELADLWDLQGATGAEYVLLAPEADNQHFIRLIHTESDTDYQPFTALGWNAAEILVNDVDTLAGSLANSPFDIVGPPADLSFTDSIRACQVAGPAGEALYLTQIKGAVPGFNLSGTDRTVAHCFVMILGTADINSTKKFYCEEFGLGDSPVIDARVTMLSAAFGLPLEQRHKITALEFADPGYLIEIDEFPAAAPARRHREGYLPSGIALVSLSCATRPISRSDGDPVLNGPPYNGKQVGFCTGPCGEMLELIYG